MPHKLRLPANRVQLA